MRLFRKHSTTKRLVVVVAISLCVMGLTFALPPITNSILTKAAVMVVAILGLSFLTGWSGQVSIGHSGFMAIGAYTTAILLHHIPNVPIVVAMIISISAGALAGLIVGLPATRLSGPYLAGMTLAFGAAVPPLIQNFSSFTGGPAGMQLESSPTAPHWLESVHRGSTVIAMNAQWLAMISIFVSGLAIFVMSNLHASRTGRAMRLVRDNDVAAELVGLNLPRTRVLAFIVSASFAGLSGSLLAYTQGAVSPQDFLVSLSIAILSLMVLGGIGTLSGAIIGGLIFAYSDNLLSWVTTSAGLDPLSSLGTNLKAMLFGALLVVTMLFAPRGISGAFIKLLAKVRTSR